MKEIKTKGISPSELPQIDLVIVSSGYEKRSTFIAIKLRGCLNDSTIKLCCGFNSNKDNIQRKRNDKLFEKLGFEYIEGSGDDDHFMEALLNRVIEKSFSQFQSINVLIDYSSMTRLWYASLLRCLYYSNYNLAINIYFAYSFAKYHPPAKNIVQNIHVNPIDGYSQFSIPDKPTALIIGMGYEAERAYGLTEYFDAETFLFYNDNSKEEEFVKDVERLNNDLIKIIPPERIYKYPISDLEYLERILYDLCKSLLDKYRVVIAPCGPKPFTLISLLISLRLNNVDVWRISPGDTRNQITRTPNGEILIYQVRI